MSDVTCAHCHEPWDTYHLQHDALYDALAEVPERAGQKEAWYTQRDKPRLDTIIPFTMTTWREAFKAAGWEFGRVVTDVRHCPCCKDNGAADNDDGRRDELAALLGDDEDGMAALLEDFHV